jgi:hypothetical protein
MRCHRPPRTADPATATATAAARVRAGGAQPSLRCRHPVQFDLDSGVRPPRPIHHPPQNPGQRELRCLQGRSRQLRRNGDAERKPAWLGPGGIRHHLRGRQQRPRSPFPCRDQQDCARDRGRSMDRGSRVRAARVPPAGHAPSPVGRSLLSTHRTAVILVRSVGRTAVRNRARHHHELPPPEASARRKFRPALWTGP